MTQHLQIRAQTDLLKLIIHKEKLIAILCQTRLAHRPNLNVSLERQFVKDMKKEIIENPPNLIFIGKREIKGELVKGEPFEFINTATGVITLPDAESQHKGFYHEKAGEIIRLFPQYYKPLVSKG